ncbi:MAG: type I methionyl aminopeptidase [Actinomycetota bacterium]
MSRSEFELKTADQILAMREAGLITAKALEAVKNDCVAGVSTLELDSIADATIRSFGAHSNFQLVAGYNHTICASVNHEVVHGIPAPERILEPGDILSIDCGAEINGWNGDSAITIIVPDSNGEIPANDIVRSRTQLSRVTEDSLWVGIAALAQAERLGEVGAAIEGYIESQGKYGILEDYVGHGIGRHMHEEPPVYNFRTKILGPKVEPGLVIAIEPMVTAGSNKTKVLQDGWTVVSKDSSDASHWEHTVALTESGVWVLTAIDGGRARLEAAGIPYGGPKE